MISFQSIGLFIVSYFIIPRLTFLPQSVHTLLIVFGPFLLPRIANVFNSERAISHSVPVRPTPYKTKLALNLLFVSAVVSLVLSLPQFGPENLFLATNSRLAIEPHVLFARVRLLLRPLTDNDEILQSKFSSVENKLIYLVFGPDSLINCVWCSTNKGNNAQNYFLYSLPKIVTPHIFHLAVLGLATSSLVGREGSRFRTHATIAGLTLMVVEAWFLGTYNIEINRRTKTMQELDFVHWRIRVLRFFTFAVVDGVLGLVLWLTSTNRWLTKPVALAERLEMTTRQAEETMHKLRALGLLSNSINRDPTLRVARELYWRLEGQELAEVVQDEEVAPVINSVLSRMDVDTIQGQIGQMADTVLAGLDSMSASQVLLSRTGNAASS